MLSVPAWISVTIMLTGVPDPLYESAIKEARHTQEADRRGELSECMNYIDKFGEHTRLWQAVLKQDLWVRPGFALLESTGSMWGGYTHALVVDGAVVRGLESDSEPKMAEAWAPFEELRRIADNPHLVVGSAESGVMDGSCYFLTVSTGKGRFRQAAIYGEPDHGTEVGRLVNALLKIASSVDLRKKLIQEGPGRPGRRVPGR